MGTIKCPDCRREISDAANFCINCGRPITPKEKENITIFSDSDVDGMENKQIKKESVLSVPSIAVACFLIFGMLIFSNNSEPAKQSQKKTLSNIETKSSVKALKPEEEALQTAIKFTESHPNSSLATKITGYKYALDELQEIKRKFPAFKTSMIASLTGDFSAKKAELEAELQKEEEERKKQAEKEEKERLERKKQLEAKLKKLEKKFRIKKDEVEDTIFLTHKSFPLYANSRSAIYPYIGRSGYSTWLRIKIQYTSESWLFVDRLIFSIDGEKIVKEFSHFDWKRDNGYSGIWEWIDLAETSEMQSLLEKIANSKKTILRFEGRQYHNDITITSADKKAILETLEYYKAT